MREAHCRLKSITTKGHHNNKLLWFNNFTMTKSIFKIKTVHPNKTEQRNNQITSTTWFSKDKGGKRKYNLVHIQQFEYILETTFQSQDVILVIKKIELIYNNFNTFFIFNTTAFFLRVYSTGCKKTPQKCSKPSGQRCFGQYN